MKRAAGAVAAAAVIASSLVVGSAGAAQANTSTVPPATNPAMADRCDIDLAIQLDYSTSMTNAQLTAQETAVKDLATALQGYPVRIALFHFGSNSPIDGTAANTPLLLTSVQTQAGVDAIHAKLDAFSRSGTNYTNWQAAFDTVRGTGESYDMLALVTDGNPTRINHPSMIQDTADNPVNQAIVDGGVTAANQLKAEGTRIVGVAVTDNLGGTGSNAYQAMLRQIPQVSGPVEGSDYYLGGLASLQQTLLDLVNANCATIDLDKVGTLSADGNTIDYGFSIENTGIVPLTDVRLTDPLPGLSAITWGVWPNPAAPGVLQPGESVTATASYTVTAEDRENGNVHNEATADGLPPTGTSRVTDRDTEDVPVLPADPSISLTKTADPLSYSAVGQTVTYTFLVENDGDVPLTAVDVDDELAGLSDVTFAVWPGAPGELQPGQSVTGTATLTITQAHIDAGKIDNTATATGTPPAQPGGGTPDPVTDTDDATVTGPALAPALTLEKEADVDAYELGDEITYTFTIENTGNVTLSGVTVTDPLPGLSALNYTWPAGNADGVLEPGQIATATATYTATQADVDRGFVHNAATATGTPPPGPDPQNPPQPPVTPPAEVTVTGPDADPSIELDKTGALSEDENTVTYTFVATNTGNVTLTDVVITDPLTGLSVIVHDGSNATAEGVLAPGEFVTGTATYTVTTGDRDAGSIVNLATVVGTPPALMDPEDPEAPGIPQEPVSDTDPNTLDLAQTAAIQLVKEGELEGDGDAASQPGDLVGYTFTVTNTGNVTLSGVTVTDAMLADAGVTVVIADDAWPGPVGVLQAGQSVVGHASYPLTQADIDNGRVDNIAVATGVSTIPDPENPGEFITPNDDDDATVPVNADPALSLVKTGGFDDEAVVGDTVTYAFTVTNTGNQTLSGVSITDEMLADAGVGIVFADDAWPGAEGVLAPGESVVASAVYTLTQADVDAGHVHNVASATGTPPTPPGGEIPPPLPPVEDEVDLPIPGDASILLVKTGELLDEAVAGDPVEYTFTVTNTGALTLSGVSITDEMLAAAGVSIVFADDAWPGAAGVLAPGESVEATASYPLTQADIDAGHVDNTAETQGTPPNAYDPEDPEGPGIPREPVEDDDTVVIPLDPEAGISLQKDGVRDGASTPGETVTYTFTVTNTGALTLSGVSITDEMLAAAGVDIVFADDAWPGAEGVLAPGESVEATAVYPLTQADIDAGGVVNVASTEGTPPNAYDPENPDGPGIPREPVTDEDPAFVPVDQAPAIQLVKTGEHLAAAPQHAGDLVGYTFVATNTGNVTLSDVVITDEMLADAGVSIVFADDAWPGAEGVLAPGESVEATAVYPLTQADIDAGHVDNVAVVVGTSPDSIDPENPDGDPIPGETVEDRDDITIPVAPSPSISLVKTGELDAEAKAGDTVTYTFVASNTGNVTLTGVEIVDPLPGLGELSYVWPGAAGVLAPGQSVVATASYTLTQADVDAGAVDNTATVFGTPPNAYDPENPDGEGIPQEPVTDEDSATIPLPPAPAIELVKTGSATGKALAGDRIEYTFVATNTGNVTLSGVVISDPLAGLSVLTYQWPGETGVLAPGQSVKATASYVLTAADITAGSVVNTATVIGYAPDGDDPVGGQSVTDGDSATVLTGKLAVTGGTAAPLFGIGAVGALLLAAGLVLLARRRKQEA